MKIIITESQYKNLMESKDKPNIVEQIMEFEGVKYNGCDYAGRVRNIRGSIMDTVDVYFYLPDDDYTYSRYRTIHFLTKNNKVIDVISTSNFETITPGFKYIPYEVLTDYFIQKAKTYLEKVLSEEHPEDNL